MQQKITLLEQCILEEEKYRFSNFSHEDALALGLRLIECSKEYKGSVAVEITINGLAVFRYFPTGTSRFHEMWLNAKRSMVVTREISTLHAFALLEETKENQLDDWHLSPQEYAGCGGGFPIRNINGTVIGSICVSGLPHLDDHAILISGIHGFLQEPEYSPMTFPAQDCISLR